jgi:hypothetical protein
MQPFALSPSDKATFEQEQGQTYAFVIAFESPDDAQRFACQSDDVVFYEGFWLVARQEYN